MCGRTIDGAAAGKGRHVERARRPELLGPTVRQSGDSLLMEKRPDAGTSHVLKTHA